MLGKKVDLSLVVIVKPTFWETLNNIGNEYIIDLSVPNFKYKLEQLVKPYRVKPKIVPSNTMSGQYEVSFINMKNEEVFLCTYDQLMELIKAGEI